MCFKNGLALELISMYELGYCSWFMVVTIYLNFIHSYKINFISSFIIPYVHVPEQCKLYDGTLMELQVDACHCKT